MEIDINVLSAVKQKKDKFSESELLAMEQASNQSRYPSEIKDVDSYSINKEAGTIISINPNKTKLWTGNPRNFSFHTDLTEITALIKQTKGNVTPVVARKLPVKDSDGVDIEIIAGSRRRAACIEACENLTVSLVIADDKKAKLIAEAENKGRKDTDLFTDCRYLKYVFDNLKIADNNLTIAMFAEIQIPVITRQTMNEKLKLADTPLWLQKTVTSPDLWTFRKAVRLKKLLSNESLDLKKLKLSLKNQLFDKPDGLLLYLIEFIGIVSEAKNISIPLNNKEASICEQKSGDTKIVIPKGSPDLIDKIELLIREFSKAQ